jgi:drug/metabolite transporter (DMT)-like permease
VSGVALALASALLFGGMSVALGFSMRRSRDALVGAFATAFSGFCVCAVVALAGREWGGKLWPYLLAGLLAPGGAQLLFVLAVREAGPARASVIAGAAPLIAVTIAVTALDEPATLPLLAGAVLVVAGVLWGASYAFLFEAFYRSRVSIVSPLVATESLFAVLLAVLLLRRTELVGRHLLLGAALVVGGGALIGAFR